MKNITFVDLNRSISEQSAVQWAALIFLHKNDLHQIYRKKQKTYTATCHFISYTG